MVLLGVCGLQFSYAFYVDRISEERKKYSQILERRCADLTSKLQDAERVIDEQAALIDSLTPELAKDDESWADIIHER